MKNSINVSPIILALVMSLSSCSVYVPNGINTPMFSQKGDAQITGSIGSGINIQGAYAATDHIGIMANGYFNNSNVTVNTDDTRKGTGKLFEVGAGYFSKTASGFAFETYAGIGFGSLNIDRTITSTKSTKQFETSATKLFIQPTIGYSIKHFDIGFTPRLSILSYKKPTTTYSAAELSADSFVNIDQTNWMFIEPTLTVRGGSETLKAQVQLGSSFKLNSQALGYTQGIYSLGIVYKFGR